jgi:hypothetical protein
LGERKQNGELAVSAGAAESADVVSAADALLGSIEAVGAPNRLVLVPVESSFGPAFEFVENLKPGLVGSPSFKRLGLGVGVVDTVLDAHALWSAARKGDGWEIALSGLDLAADGAGFATGVGVPYEVVRAVDEVTDRAISGTLADGMWSVDEYLGLGIWAHP